MAQPSDLMNPIPQSGPQTVNIDIQRTPAAQPQAQPQPQGTNVQFDPAFAQILGQPSPAPSVAPAGGGIDPDFLSLTGDTGMQGLPNRFAAGEQDILGDPGRDPGMFASMIQGFGRSPQEDALLLEKVYGPGNVKIQNKKIFFREPGQKDFQSIESEKLGLAARILNQMARGSGMALEAITGAGPAVVGSAMGGPVAGVAGGIAGGVAGSAAREGAVSALLGQDRQFSDVDPMNEALLAGGLGGAGSAVGQAVGRFGRALYQGSTTGRVSKIANIRAALDEVKQNVIPEHWNVDAGPSLTKEGREKAFDAAAPYYQDIVGREADRLGQQIRAARNTLVERAGDNKFQMTNTADSLGNILKEYEGRGVTFDKDTGKVIIGGDAAPVAPFGIQGGEGVLNQVSNMYNTLIDAQKNGGVPAGDVIDLTRKIEDLAKFDQSVQKSKVFPWREATQAAIQDRDALARSVLDPDALTRYDSAYKEYAGKIDATRAIQDQIGKALQTESRADLIDSVVSKNNPKLFRDFKMVAGPEAASEVKANFVTHLIDKHVDESTGLFKADSFLKDLKGYGKELVGSPNNSGEILSQNEYRQLVHLSSKMKELDTSDLVKKKSILNAIMNAPFFMTNNFTSVRGLGTLFGRALKATPENEKMLSNMVDEAIDKVSPKEVQRLLNFRDVVEESWRLRSAKALTGSTASKLGERVLQPNRSKQETFQP